MAVAARLGAVLRHTRPDRTAAGAGTAVAGAGTAEVGEVQVSPR